VLYRFVLIIPDYKSFGVPRQNICRLAVLNIQLSYGARITNPRQLGLQNPLSALAEPSA